MVTDSEDAEADAEADEDEQPEAAAEDAAEAAGSEDAPAQTAPNAGQTPRGPAGLRGKGDPANRLR